MIHCHGFWTACIRPRSSKADWEAKRWKAFPQRRHFLAAIVQHGANWMMKGLKCSHLRLIMGIPYSQETAFINPIIITRTEPDQHILMSRYVAAVASYIFLGAFSFIDNFFLNHFVQWCISWIFWRKRFSFQKKFVTSHSRNVLDVWDLQWWNCDRA